VAAHTGVSQATGDLGERYEIHSYVVMIVLGARWW
jgi:hypothetical protein